MVDLFLFILGTIGLTHILVDGVIFEKPRALLKKILPTGVYKMLECYQCAGTWCGFICGYLMFGFDLRTIFICGCAGSFLATLAATYVTYLEAKAIVDLK